MVSIPVLIVLLFLSFASSGSEAALFSILKVELQGLGKGFFRKVTTELKNNEHITLFVLLLVNTVVNAYAASLFSAIFNDFLKSLNLQVVPYQILDVLIFTVLILIIGDVTPKLLAVKFPLRVLRFFSLIIYPFYIILKPIVQLLPQRFTYIKKFETFEDVIDELEDLAMSQDAVLRSRISLLHARVGDLMTPKDSVIYLKFGDTVAHFREVASRYGYRIYPVLEDTEIKGIVSLDNIKLIRARTDEKIKNYTAPCKTVPVTSMVFKVIKEERGDDFFAVVDEYGNFVGILTKWDIFERLNPEPRVRWIDKKSVIVPGDITLHDFELVLRRKLSFSAPTLQALIMEETGRIPNEGEIISIEDMKLEILEKEFAKILRVRVELK